MVSQVPARHPSVKQIGCEQKHRHGGKERRDQNGSYQDQKVNHKRFLEEKSQRTFWRKPVMEYQMTGAGRLLIRPRR